MRAARPAGPEANPIQAELPAVARSCWLANLAALYRRDPELARQLEQVPFAHLPSLEAARGGGFTARVPADAGAATAVADALEPERIYLHSRYEPQKEAARFVHALPAAENPVCILFGVGLGYYLVELERQREQPVLVAVEPDLALLKATLCLHELAGLITSGRLVFLTVADRRAVHEKLSRCNADLMLGVQLVVPPYSKRRGAAFFEQMSALIQDFIAYQRMQMVTLVKTSQTTLRNVAWNLTHYLRSSGVEALAGRAAGYPAIVVSAGPSLARNIAQLPALRGRAVIISVQTVFKLLSALGCPPHFVTSLDFHDISMEFFRGVQDVGGCTLVAEPKASWRVLDAWPGKVCVLHHAAYDRLLRGAVPRRGGLPAGTTVAHLAFYLAQHLGCDPILFVGQDLAFSEGLFYLPGSPIEDIWRPELGRFVTVETRQWERIVRNRGLLRTATDIGGRPVYTDELLMTYYEQFAKDFAAAPQRIIQCSEGGLAPPGMQVMPLAQAARQFCSRPLPDTLSAGAWEAPDRSVLTAAQTALRERIAELAEVTRIAERMHGLLAELSELLDRPEAFNRVVARVDALRVEMQRHEQMYALVADAAAQAQLRRHSADRRIGAPQRETPEIARRRLARDQEFVEAFLESCRFLAGVLPRALARVQESG